MIIGTIGTWLYSKFTDRQLNFLSRDPDVRISFAYTDICGLKKCTTVYESYKYTSTTGSKI